MNKNAIKKYAIWARKELIERVSQRAMIYGITPKEVGHPDADSVNGHLLSQTEKKQRQALIRNIQAKGFTQVMEEVAYTWFNRFAALRFMEVNGYLPSHVRVFTNDAGEFKPQILAEAIHLELDGLDMKKVYALENENKSEELFKYLLIVQCNALNSILPGMFQRIDDYTELLFPENLLDKASVVGRMISDISENYFRVNSEHGQVEIIGWLYQYYISEKHEEIIDPLHGREICAEDVPAATQLFTTDWVVRYIVDNSVGRYWMERHAGSLLASDLQYYIPLEGNSVCNENITPQNVTVLDPCVGSGHFLVYAIDVLMKIYREYGYSDREAIAEIISHNIFGLDIDKRAVDLAYFAIMMKGCQYDRRFLKRGIQPRIYNIVDSRFADEAFMTFFCGSDTALRACVSSILEPMKNAFETGSLVQIPVIDFEALQKQIDKLNVQIDLFHANQLNSFFTMMNVLRTLSEHYAVVITNPPYLNKYDEFLKIYLQNNYKDYSGDLFSVFIYRCMQLCKSGGYAGLMTPNVWMFIKSYEKLRRYILKNHSITTLVQMAKGAFFSEATVDVCAFVIQCNRIKQIGVYFRLEDFVGNMDYQNEKLLEAIDNPLCGYRYRVESSLFDNLPGMQIGYWAGEHILRAFQTGKILEKQATPRQGLATTNNNKYLRHWYEVEFTHIGFNLDRQTAIASEIKWFPYNKGGEFRKWYGNQNYIVNYLHDGESIKHDVLTKYPYLKTPDFVVKNPETYFSPSLSWSKISSGSVAFRYFPQGFLYDVSGCSIFFKNSADLYYFAGFLNCIVCAKILEIISPTLNYETGHIAILPLIDSKKHRSRIEQLVQENIRISEEDWDKAETSWGFAHCPLMTITIGDTQKGFLVADKYVAWEDECNTRFAQLKANEEELNRIFIDIYGLKDELTPEVEDKDVTVRKADLQREIKSLISYAVGCMFGRYSLDKDGLVYAGGEFSEQWLVVNPDRSQKIDAHKSLCYLRDVAQNAEITDLVHSHFGVDADNIIPVTDDEYFEDDIVSRFVKFVEVGYGKDTLEENLTFIANALGGKGSSREVIRKYFLNDFFEDHVKIYQKRPIYWLFDSGKKNGFKCLIYMHRYQPDTIARIRTDYVHEQQSRYRTAIADLEQRMNGASTGERVKLNKRLTKLQDQATELRVYEEKIHHLADQMIAIDLDDGVKVNYAKFQDVLAKVK